MDIDPSYGPLVPLCRELRTEAGPVDLAFINPDGLLTLVECKLWRNPEARRKVVAQVLDYVRSIARWSYSDFQRQVAMATGHTGNVPFELVRESHPELEERRFVDAVSRSIRSGRFLLLVAGDGIREDVGALAELINRNAALGFSFGLFEVALYGLGSSLAIQPRVLARTFVMERTVVLVRDDEETVRVKDIDTGDVTDAGETVGERSPSALVAAMREWWSPLEGLTFDDPEQQPARFTYPQNLRTPLPWPGTWLTAYRTKTGQCGVFIGGRQEQLRELTRELIADGVLEELPAGTREGRDGLGLIIIRREAEFGSIQAEQQWLARTMNDFVNVLRPRIKRLERERLET